MFDEIKKILKKNGIDGRKVSSISNEIVACVTDKYGRDAADSSYIPRNKDEFIFNTKGKKNVMTSGKTGVTLNQTGNE